MSGRKKIILVSLDKTKVCSEKKFTRISMYYENSVKFCGKSLRSANSRHPKVSKMVRQVYISQKMPSVDMILCFKKISANTIFVKKEFQISCHYASQTPEFLKSEGIFYVPWDQNSPNAP